MRCNARHSAAYWLTVFVLVLSVPAYRMIPHLEPWGFDLHNLHAFHTCARRNDPYEVSGAVCHDTFGRSMLYPPLLYWSFAWLRAVTLERAVVVWAAFIAITLVTTLLFWAPKRQREAIGTPELWVFSALLVAQFPSLFAMERGNNDILVVLPWALAFWAFARERFVAAGGFLAVAVALKLYPAVAVAPLLVGLGWQRSFAALTRMALGIAVVLAGAFALLFEQTLQYFRAVLPRFAETLSELGHYSHSTRAYFGSLATAVFIVPFAVWCWAASRRIATAPADIFAGSLAISTYLAGVSYDYNLVTTYPLLLMLLAHVCSRAGTSVVPAVLCGVGVIVVAGHRGMFADALMVRVHVGLQLAWLTAAGIYVAMTPSDLDTEQLPLFTREEAAMPPARVGRMS